MSTYSNGLQPALQNLLQCVVWFFHPRSSCTTTHMTADVQRITLNASCMTISGWRTKQLDIFCRVTGFTSDFLSFILVEHIQCFHGTLQLLPWSWLKWHHMLTGCCGDQCLCTVWYCCHWWQVSNYQVSRIPQTQKSFIEAVNTE